MLAHGSRKLQGLRSALMQHDVTKRVGDRLFLSADHVRSPPQELPGQPERGSMQKVRELLHVYQLAGWGSPGPL